MTPFTLLECFKAFKGNYKLSVKLKEKHITTTCCICWFVIRKINPLIRLGLMEAMGNKLLAIH